MWKLDYKVLLLFQGAVSVINSKLSLLEPGNLEHVEVRLHSIIQKLDKIAEKKSTQEDGEKQNRVRQIAPPLFKKCRVLHYTLHSKNWVQASHRLPVCQRIAFTLCWEHI